MENCLFRILSFEEYKEYGYKFPSVLFCGYGFNQKAFTDMARGYRNAADQLAQQQIELGINSQNNLLYPIFFCYRQATELMLKAILLNCLLPYNKYVKEAERKKISPMITHHVLSVLFKDIQKSLNSTYSPLLGEIRPYLNAMNEFDPSSYEMRYPADKELYASLYQEQITGFDIQYTKEHYEVFWSLLLNLYYKTEQDWADCKSSVNN